MAFELDIGFASSAGTKDSNEDFCGALMPEPGLEGMGVIAAVADGVSRGGMGKEAAQTTVVSLLRDYFGTPETWDATVALDRIISSQNAWLCGINRRRQPAVGMTTLTAVVLRGQSYALAHVGDSRAYLLRGGLMQQITHDHVVNHPDFKHQLVRAVGLEERVVVDYVQGDLQVGDVFVLLTDGVYGSLSDKRVQALAEGDNAQASSQAACEALLDAALKAGSKDNVTALVVRVLGLLDATLQDENRAAQSLPVPPLLKVGEVLDGLTITASVADNGINVVYQAKAIAPAAGADTDKRYIIKALHPARAHDREELAMLAHEAWLAKRMQSSRAADNLVQIYNDLPGLPEGRTRSAFYLVYDWHGGETLEQALAQQKRFKLPQALAVGLQALKALGRLHRQGVIHRDIKPANLHQGEDGVLRLLDLGVALSGREPQSMRELHAGTPSYVNPEQWGFNCKTSARSGGQRTDVPQELPDAQSDLFALGVTLYQLLTGRLPYGEVLPYQVGRYYRDPVAPSRHNPEIPIWLDHVLMKAVARDKRQRFETAEEFRLALERGASRPLSAPSATPLLQRDPTALWKVGLAVSVLLNLLLVYWLLFLPK
ncbi:bifunctional protein-serine/threonine kinase/phosphatase [Rhodoferax sp. AJA081-3]|uniref:bifunctional protein-serine/threonine kinase/phosphatase n=1 Tax=Rhodoferax sp. AJA081-3 TaxID=2752316 RepID=UPI001ADF7094|nr:bifunctional protein-serine/threonine kinase/phosphatase [Rhodoferax sp. AJA081-3]QTN28269.1 bifunctional protein-serine/threonine kinase/phosphatase [Rhodoferax sp. AJA081-3]